MSEEGVRRISEMLNLDEFEAIALGHISDDLEGLTEEGPDREEKLMELGRLLGPKVNDFWIANEG